MVIQKRKLKSNKFTNKRGKTIITGRIKYPTEKEIISINKEIARKKLSHGFGFININNLSFYLHEIKIKFKFKTKRKSSIYKSAWLMHRIAKDQIFLDGNKRTAGASGILMLRKNNHDIKHDSKAFAIHLKLIQSKRINVKDTALWLSKRLVR